MRQKNTVYSLEYHEPSLESKDGIKMAEKKKSVSSKKDEKQGQSEYRKKIAQQRAH